MGMEFPIAALMDEDACYQWLVKALHPRGLACPRCGPGDGNLTVHRRRRQPVLDYRCRACGRVFNAFTGTTLAGTHRRPSQLVLILRGVSKGETTLGLANELGCSRPHLHQLRQRLQANAALTLPHADPAPLVGDDAAEADECYIAAGEKRHPPHGPRRPAASAGAQTQGARYVRQRPPARVGRGRARHRSSAS
jgi:transposase-like protein